MTLHLRWLALALICVAVSCNSNEQNAAQIDQEDQEVEVKKADTTRLSPALDTSALLNLPQVPVLCYHRIQPVARDEYSVTPAAFAAQMQALADSGYQSILPDDLYAYLHQQKQLPAKPVMISFDDTRLEHFTIAKPNLEKHNFRGVFFIMTIAIGKKNYMSRQQLATLDSAGHVLGSHTWDHHKATEYTDSAWQVQLHGSQKTIENITGKPVKYFAYPFGLWNKEAAAYLNDKSDIKLAFILSGRRDSTYPFQTVRRMIVPPQWSAQGMIKAMRSTFAKNR